MSVNRFAAVLVVGAMISAATLSHRAEAGEADVLDVRVQSGADGTYRFDVTIRHADEGWDHYADAFEIVGPDGTVLGTRVLLHPHVSEQPFTRSLSGVPIATGVTTVSVRAHDKVHGLGGAVQSIALPGRKP